MTGVAINGSKIVESVASNYVSYTERYQSGTRCTRRDPETNRCTREEPVYSTDDGSTDAVINGVVVSNHAVKINGVSLVVVGDITEETWKADPPPSPSHGGSIISVSPGTSGSGQGKVISGATNLNLNDQKIALIGSQVETCLGTVTTIEDGLDKINYN